MSNAGTSLPSLILKKLYFAKHPKLLQPRILFRMCNRSKAEYGHFLAEGRTLGLLAAFLLMLVVFSGCTNIKFAADLTVSNPLSQTVSPGQAATFSVSARGAMPITFQWLKSGAVIPGATASTYVTPPVTFQNDGTDFSVQVSNVTSKATSATATLHVRGVSGSYPVITSQPKAVNACVNSTFELSVAATDATKFQWQLNGVSIPGATSSTYTISNAQTTQSGVYTCLVSNAFSSVTTSPVTVYIGSMITAEPSDITLDEGQAGSFSVAAEGQAPFTYQWFKIAPGGGTGSAIAGAISATYTLPPTTIDDDGSQFYVIVSDACGTDYKSSLASLMILADVPPTIIQQSAAQTVEAGASARFSAVASGTKTITYQWYRIPAGQTVATLISNATDTTYTVPPNLTDPTNNGDQYYVIATNPYGQATSKATLLAVASGIVIVEQPLSQYLQVGQTASFAVTASSTSPLTYQWFEAIPGSANFTAIAGATSVAYSKTNVSLTDYGTTFHVVVSNGSSSVTSVNSALFVGALNQVADFCNSAWIPNGSTMVSGASGCSYQLTDSFYQSGQLAWPQLIATVNLNLTFTISITTTSGLPADGFTVVLADPTQGATPSRLGANGGGLGAQGIPGLVVAFDTFQNDPPDAPIVPYAGVTRGNTDLWEAPWFNYNNHLRPIAVTGQTIQTKVSITLLNGQITLTQNGKLVFSGATSAVPPTAYLLITAGTGAYDETVIVSQFSSKIGSP